jgi:hypothetical protein
MDKRCGTCRETLLISEFRVDSKTKDGLSPRCVPCANQAEATSYLGLKLRAVEHLGDRCSLCGYDADHRAFAFDHVDGAGATARRSGMLGRRLLNAILAGTAGHIQLLCCNCNAIKRVESDERGHRVYTRSTPPLNAPDKWCPRCEAVKAAVEFASNAARYDGLSSYCRLCVNKFQQDRYKALRVRTIEHLGGQCVKCGYHENPRALVIDHVDGGGGKERKSGIVMSTALKAALDDESGIYQLLCANCNQIKSFDGTERVGKRTYRRTVPTTRIDRPSLRWTPEQRAANGARLRACWDDPGYRARQSAFRSATMKARWASGEIPTRRKKP